VESVIRIRAVPEAEDRTRLEVESMVGSGGWIDFGLGRRTLRRFAGEMVVGPG